MRMLTSLTVVVLVGLSVGALAATLTITQKGRGFLVREHHHQEGRVGNIRE